MCCLFTTLVLLGPRIAGVFWWIFQPVRWNLAFNSWIWPMLGLMFLPWTTLMYVISFAGGIIWWEWMFIGFALLTDIGSYAGGGYGNRGRMPGYGN